VAKLRNISPDTLQVPLLGATVEPDQVVDVPDQLFKDYAWPDSLWSVVSAKKTEKES
jgi:hypothetical protein